MLMMNNEECGILGWLLSNETRSITLLCTWNLASFCDSDVVRLKLFIACRVGICFSVLQYQ
jgi:hypothetical protein